ncbi:DNA polymerase [Staphylococcus phage Twort]|uniref:ORF004 n=1 Tax=Staphylococcus phage Twort (strain DSM 17442 / HER 48) TaxID=2908167 RepID=Q4Z997_BPTWO|nr:DNA polymerase [Staphylococcus phage Twort]AAX92300.1 ORF004 [Staphylococcus phage Twort]
MKALILFDHIREEHYSVVNGKPQFKLLQTPNGKILKSILSKFAGLERTKEVKNYDINFLYNAIPQPIYNDYGKIIKYNDVKQSEVKPYYERMNNIITENKYDIIIPLGKLGVKYLLNVSSIGKVRGVPTKVDIGTHQTWVLPTYSIEYTNVNKNAERHVVADLELVGKFVKNGEDAFTPKEVDYELVTNIERVREIFNKEVKNDNNDGVDITAWDLETNSLSPEKKGSKPLVLSMSWKNGQGVTIPLYKSDFTWENGQQDIDEILAMLKEWVASKEDIKVAHNGQYDINFLMSSQNFTEFNEHQDTKVGWYLAVTQEEAESLKLSDISYEVTDMGGYDKPLENFKKWFIQDLLKYLSDALNERKKENKKPVKKEYDIKAPDYDSWIKGKLQEPVDLDNHDIKLKVSEEEKVYTELGLVPEILNKNIFFEDTFKELVSKYDVYMNLSSASKEYVLDTAINLINKYKNVKDVINDVDGNSFNYDWIPLELMHPYASGDTDACRRIYCDVINKLKEQNRPKALELLTKSYPRLTRTLARIQSNGMYTDTEYLYMIDDKYSNELDKIEQKLRSHWVIKEFEDTRYDLYMAGVEEFESNPPKERNKSITQYRDKFKNGGWKFKPSSGAHKGEVLFSILGISLPYEKEFVKDKPFTKGVKEDKLTWEDYKTNKSTIDYIIDNIELKKDCIDVVVLMKKYAELQTKRNSFTKKLPNLVNKETSTLHGNFNSTGTASARLSSSAPNLQQLPSHTSDVNKFDYHYPVKRAFKSRYKNGIMTELDFSAIEMKIIGLYTKDPEMLESFLKGEDIHKSTASIVYNKPVEDITAEERQNTKKVNFGIAYGESPFSFSGKNNMTVEEAEEIFNKYFNTKPSVKNSIDATHDFVQKHGYVEAMQGHQRFIRDAQSSDKKKRNQALRQSFNTIIQSTAGYLTNMALTFIDDFIQQNNIKSKIVATVHDSILIDTHPDDIFIIGKVSKHIMENLPYDFLFMNHNGSSIRYPIEADFEIGLAYNDMVEYDEEDMKTFNKVENYIKYKMSLKTIKEYFESGKLTEEQYKQKVSIVESEKYKYQQMS